MKRPCIKTHPVPQPESCHFCWLYMNDERYHALYEGKQGSSIAQKAASLAGAVVKHVLSGMKEVSEQEYKDRLAVCDKCPSGLCNKSGEVWTCGACGCSLNGTSILPAKAKWATQDCPKGHWPKRLSLPIAE